MPLIINQDYKRPYYTLNKHFETVIPSAIRKVEGVQYVRERINTDDQDFLDLDWIKSGQKRLLVISHGLEGSTYRPYVQGAAKLFAKNDWDVLAWNCRSCSEEMNVQPTLYHHGFTKDLFEVIDHAQQMGYQEIFMLGFSMGGSLTSKFFGEIHSSQYTAVKAGMAVSVPCDLAASSKYLALRKNRFYQNRFMKKLTIKMAKKNEQFPGFVELRPWKSFNSFHEFDSHYSARIFGFKDAQDFYENVQCLPYLPEIKRPFFILNAWNDPMLGETCYPKALAEGKDNLTLEITQHGGHVGFLQKGKEHTYAEERALEFFSAHSAF